MDTNRPILEVRAMTLAQMLSGPKALVIPDMQRDFTWSPRQVKSLVSGLAFVFHNVRAKASTFADNPVGLVYGYTSPSGHIHIIDGQQRLTTLFLLIGMLYRRTRRPELRTLLINDDEMLSGRLPRIIYQAKRHALYFLSDLVTHFFLDCEGRLSRIENASWYFSHYSSDASVQSFIAALRAIDEVLEQCADDAEFSFHGFSRFVAECVSFRYGRLPGRAEAESLFVTINTTGEPLSMAQNLRALHVALDAASDLDAAEKWNEMEQFFWERRLPGDRTADRALDSFLALLEPYMRTLPTIDELYPRFTAYRRLEEAVGRDALAAYAGDPIALAFLIVPSLDFACKFADAPACHLRRFFHLLANILRYQRPSPLGTDTRLALDMVEMMKEPDILSLLHLRHAPARIVNAEERAKLSILEDATPQQRQSLEAIFEKGEAHPLLAGRLLPVLKWCGDPQDPGFAASLSHYIDKIYSIFGTDLERSDRLDTLRRTMLALRHPAYPVVRKGDTILSLCWHIYDWQRLMQSAPGLVRHLIDRLENLTPQEIIKRFSDRSYPYYNIIKNKEIIGGMRKKQLLRPCQPFTGYFDIKEEVMRWSVGQRRFCLPAKEWTAPHLSGYRSLVCYHLASDLAIAITYMPRERRPYCVEVFTHADSGLPHLDPRSLHLRAFAYHKPSGRHRAYFPTPEAALSAIADLTS